MNMQFTKMNGLGNDFVVVNAIDVPFSLTNQEIKKLGHRKMGIGFDQLLVVERAETGKVDFNYRIFNTDGSEVEHCGNGARCFAKYVIDNQLTDKKTIDVKIRKGVIRITYEDDDNIRVDMGKAILKPKDIPFIHQADYSPIYELTVLGQSIKLSVLSMGNPHAVINTNDLWQKEIDHLGGAIQTLSVFPESVNVNFAEIKNRKNINLRTYERGVGETDACGTGACASVFAFYQQGLVDSEVVVQLRNGKLIIHVDNEDNIFMSGEARTVYTGNINVRSEFKKR